ncbi:hypothetical protein TNCV_267161 [Trichonephila clavipes]|nr:hypothetical protein TNCV_267161 [Trichonephila clavipes]
MGSGNVKRDVQYKKRSLGMLLELKREGCFQVFALSGLIRNVAPSQAGPRIVKIEDVERRTGSDVVQSGRPLFDDFFQHLWPYIGNNTTNVLFQKVKRLWFIRIDQ